MASSEELLLLYGQLLDLSRLMAERLKTPGIYEGRELLNGDFLPLMIIASREGISQADLSQHLRRSKAATSFIVNKLEDRELVKRVRRDTRCLLYLTEKGRRFCALKQGRDMDTANHVMEVLPLDRDELHCANHVMEELIAFCRQDADRKQEEN